MLCCSSILTKEAIRRIHPLCLCRRHTDLPFDVKAQTRIPKEFADPEILEGFPPTMSFAHIYMLEHRKEQKCSVYPFYKKFPLPDSNLNSLLSYLSFLL